MSGWIDDRCALVVGACSGLGRAVIDIFAAEGARVAVLERDPDKCAGLSEECPDVVVTTGDATTRTANED